MNSIDSHCHIDGPEYDADREDVIARAVDAGLTTMLNVGTGDPHSGAFERAVELSEKHREVFCALGVHPHDAKLFDNGAEQRLIDLANGRPRVIAWGEIGLDYHYDHSPRDVQREVFRRQLQIARSLHLPVIIHSREANDDTMQILRAELGGPGVPPVNHAQDACAPGVLHCFGGTLQMAQDAIELGFYISFAGTLTFKKADGLREIARQLPLERLLVETDCPYLTPVPYRGKRNEPARVVETAKVLAGIHGRSFDEIGRITSENFARLFRVTPE